MSQSQGIEVRPSRRTIAKGAAWAVPVIAVGAAAPAMAASGGPLVFTGISCKGPGQSGGNTWTYYMQAELTLQATSTVSILSIVECSGSPTLTSPRAYEGSTPLGQTFTLNSGVHTLDIFGDSTNSAMSCFNVTYTVDGTTYVGTYAFGEFKPCCTGASSYCPVPAQK